MLLFGSSASSWYTRGMTESLEQTPHKQSNTLPATFKADITNYRRRLGVMRIGIALAVSLLIWLRFGFVAWIIFVVVIALILTVGVIALSRRTLTVYADKVEYKNAFGMKKTIALQDIEAVKVF